MAPRPGNIILKLEEGDPYRWDYFDSRLQIRNQQRTKGAFRAFSVADLRKSPPVIKLSEWTDLAHGKKRAKGRNNYPRYAAISHVWDPSDETAGTARAAGRPLKVKVKGSPPIHEISWLGLVQAADAADQQDCEYLWLDFLCIDQLPRDEEVHDKALQISNMANIYKNAKRVICMLGGVSAVQSLDSKTTWMDRAWTLQEATLNQGRTYAYVKWPYQKDFVINPGPTSYPMNFTPVTSRDPSLMLIKLSMLLEMPPLTDTTNTTPSLGLPSGFKVVCLDGIMNTSTRAINASRNAMLSVYRGSTLELRRAGVWRAMLLRTSTHPVDIAYSVMGLFDVQLDPYREDRSVQYLFNDLARKAAAISKPDMGWLVVGGVLGSVGKLKRDRKSFLIPRVPNYQLKQKPPRYHDDGGTWKWSSNVVDDSRYGIKKYHIQFHTNSRPHIMCAVMLKVTKIKHNPPGRGYKTASFTIGGKPSQCKYNGTIYNGMTAMMVGTVGSWGEPKLKGYEDWQYVMFMKWTRRNGWVLKGDGIVNGTGINDKWVKGSRHWHFTVGKGAQKVLSKWPCEGPPCEGVNPPINTNPLPMSYGVLPMANYDVSVSVAPRKIQWFGYKGEKPLYEEWSTFKFWNNMFPGPSNKEVASNHPLWLVACSSANPPKFTDAISTSRLYSFIYLPMEWTEVSLATADIDTLKSSLQSSLTMGLNLRTYRVAVRFTKYMIYLKSVPSKMQKRLNPHFTNTAVVSYSRKNTQNVLNSNYVIKKVKGMNPYIATDPYSSFTKRLRNITRGDWSTYPDAIRNTYPGEILWTDGIRRGSLSGYNISTFEVVRRDPNTASGAVIARGLADANPYYFQLLD